MNRNADRTASQVEALLMRHLRQPQCVCRRANQNRSLTFKKGMKALLGGLPTTRYHHRADSLRAFERRPEPDEWTKREGNINTITRSHAGALVNFPPTSEPPIPAFLCVQPEKRRAGSPGGLMDADVVLDRVGQVASKRRVKRLIFKKFFLCCKGKFSKGFRFREAVTIKPIPLDQDWPHLPEARPRVRHGAILQPFAKH